MNSIEKTNHATLTRWYDEMWGQCNHALITDIVGETYFRHDTTGANNLLAGHEYQSMVANAVDGDKVTEFTYSLVAEGDYVASLGCYIRNGTEQWDWVQMFRVQDGKMRETWLPGMGGTDERAEPTPATAWVGGEVPKGISQNPSPSKTLIHNWYQALANAEDTDDYLAESVRWHDTFDTKIQLSPQSLNKRIRSLMKNDRANNLELFMIEQDDIVVAMGAWSLGDDQRTWNWVQAFRIEDNKIVEGWANSHGGTDPSKLDTKNLWDPTVLPAGSVHFGTRG